MKNNFAKLSVQYDKFPKFDINPKIVDEYNKYGENKITHRVDELYEAVVDSE